MTPGKPTFTSNPGRRHVFLIALLVTTQCHRGVPPESGSGTHAPLPRYWLQRASLSEVPNGPPVRSVQDPVLIELAEDGHVSSLPGAKEMFAGYLAETTLTRPADRAGLMLYAQRTTELHLDSKGGPVIGRLHPGAFVGVAVSGEGRGVVAVPRYTRTNAAEPRTLLAYVDANALGPHPVREVAPAFEGRRVYNFGLPLHLRDQWAAVDNLLCGAFHVVEGQGDTRATQYYRGVEVSGWLESSWNWGDHGPTPCPARSVFRHQNRLVLLDGRDWLDTREIPSIPAGFMLVEPPRTDPLGAALVAGKSIYWLTRSSDQLACREWRPKAHWLRAGQTGVNGLAQQDMLQGELLQRNDSLGTYHPISYTPVAVDKSGGSIELLGPYFKRFGTGYKCVVAFQLRAARGDVLFVERLGTHSSGGAPPKEYTRVAFHPQDVEHWYLTQDSCNAALASAERAIQQNTANAERLGLHVDCNDQPP